MLTQQIPSVRLSACPPAGLGRGPGARGQHMLMAVSSSQALIEPFIQSMSFGPLPSQYFQVRRSLTCRSNPESDRE